MVVILTTCVWKLVETLLVHLSVPAQLAMSLMMTEGLV